MKENYLQELKRKLKSVSPSEWHRVIDLDDVKNLMQDSLEKDEIIHDLQVESIAYEKGRQEERAILLDQVNKELYYENDQKKPSRRLLESLRKITNYLQENISEPLPPRVVRSHNEKLTNTITTAYQMLTDALKNSDEEDAEEAYTNLVGQLSECRYFLTNSHPDLVDVGSDDPDE